MPRRPTTWLQVSAYRYLSRRLECALLGQDPAAAGMRARGQPAALAAGAGLTAAALAAATLLGLLRPHVALDGARVVLARDSGALFVRVGDTWHPVLNLASARLIAASAVDPLTIRQADLDGSKRGPLLGIPGAPAFLGRPLAAADTAWSLCDSDGAGATTTILLGRPDAASMRVLGGGQAMLVAAAAGSPAYLLHDGHRARVDLADAAVVRTLRLEGRAPRLVSQSLLEAVPEAAPIAVPRIPGLGGAAPGLPGFAIGTVLRIIRADGDEYYAVLAGGVQRIGRVA
ncbi:type VII secretion protein EccB, partial [Mycobacterium avium subsp. hominissuis]|uniref:type VII secretion protein EccB n=1 Tax=Mycobacterium avium TaxID=1764 RepID=UPI001CC4CD09